MNIDNLKYQKVKNITKNSILANYWLIINQTKLISLKKNFEQTTLLIKIIMSTNLAATTKLKVSQLYPQSFIRLIDRRNMFFIGHKTGIHLYDIGTGKI